MIHGGTRRPVRRGPVPAAPRVGALLPGVLARLGHAETLEAWRAVVEWPAIAGPALGKHSEATRVAGGVLIVEVGHPALMHELSHRKAELLDRLHSHLGSRRIRDVRLVLKR